MTDDLFGETSREAGVACQGVRAPIIVSFPTVLKVCSGLVASMYTDLRLNSESI